MNVTIYQDVMLSVGNGLNEVKFNYTIKPNDTPAVGRLVVSYRVMRSRDRNAFVTKANTIRDTIHQARNTKRTSIRARPRLPPSEEHLH